MQDFEKHEDMIPAYLAGKLPDEKRQELEARLAECQELRETLKEFHQLYSGMAVMDAASSGHIDSEQLVAYSDDPGSFTPALRENIENHLDDCADCREELKLCRDIPAVTDSDQGWIASMLQWFMTPRVALRPAYVVAAVCLLILPQVYMVATRDSFRPSVAELHLQGVTRDVVSTNILEIRPDNKITHLEFVLPVLKDRRYDYELHNSDGQLLFVKPNNPPKDVLAVEIPSTYFR